MLTKKILATAAAAAMLVAAAPNSADIAKLSWFTGHWTAETNGVRTEESWLAPHGGTMLGVGRTSDTSKTHYWEMLRIDNGEDGTLTYWGAPEGGPATPFRLTKLSAREAVFENPSHDFPTTIRYQLEGSSLVATISGPEGANAQSARYRKAR